MDFGEALEVLGAALRFGINPSLAGIRQLTEALGSPQSAFASVQVTGTNGKSSVTRLTASLLAAEGARTAAYTSPHLVSYTERIEIGGTPVGERDFAAALTVALDASTASGGPGAHTEFELLTAAALWLMRERGVDFACLEVGMGGRWDATSVVDPAVAVITGVGLDHTERLGSTVEAIAADKAHIIKPGCSVVLGPGTAWVADIFLERAERFELHPRFVAPWSDESPVAEDLTVRFQVTQPSRRPGGSTLLEVRGVHAIYDGLSITAPAYQAANVATAVAAAECALGRALDREAVRAAVSSIRFPGRFEMLGEDPLVVIDGAHNAQAAAVLASAVIDAWPDPSVRPVCVLGMLADKDAEGIVSAMAKVTAGFVVTSPRSERAVAAADLAETVLRVTGMTPVACVDDVAAAVRVAGDGAGPGGVLVTGSLYTAGEARRALTGR